MGLALWRHRASRHSAEASHLRSQWQQLHLHTNEQATPAGPNRRSDRDRSQVRPEWSLTNSAFFIVAPRLRTRRLEFAASSLCTITNGGGERHKAVVQLVMSGCMFFNGRSKRKKIAGYSKSDRHSIFEFC
ncbi:putative inorganic carbon transporter subunit DabA [Nitrococcus mobilis]|uniref:putative inorganic carbon transporter subunit DabA n=1 Tax=Nitrococcus mobilis TaxID=35797 RepID=UPI0012EA264A